MARLGAKRADIDSDAANRNLNRIQAISHHFGSKTGALSSFGDFERMRYFSRFWDETRGDEFDFWGTSWWFFEIDGDGDVNRVLQLYECGQILRYSEEHLSDRYGAIPDPFPDLDALMDYEISQSEFEAAWMR